VQQDAPSRPLLERNMIWAIDDELCHARTIIPAKPLRQVQIWSPKRQAADIRPSLELRNEAIACFTLTDARVAKQWQRTVASLVVLDPDCERFASWSPAAGLVVCRVAAGAELLRLPGGTFTSRAERSGISAGSP
jgi:hypothetical protein